MAGAKINLIEIVRAGLATLATRRDNLCSVADPERFDADPDPDPTFHADADPDPNTFY